MKRVWAGIAIALTMASVGAAVAPSRHLWLLTATNVPGVPGPGTPQTQYGVQVFCGTNNPEVAGWKITLDVITEQGGPVHFEGELQRSAVAPAGFTDVAVFWVGIDPDIIVTGLLVTDIQQGASL